MSPPRGNTEARRAAILACLTIITAASVLLTASRGLDITLYYPLISLVFFFLPLRPALAASSVMSSFSSTGLSPWWTSFLQTQLIFGSKSPQ